MPVIEASFKDLKKLVGKNLPKDTDKLWDVLSYVKAGVDDMEGDVIKLEVADTNRPDLWCIEGIARALKGALSIEKGSPQYKTLNSNFKVVVGKGINKIRPFIATAIIKGIKFTDEFIKQIVQYSEKLDMGIGRKRAKTSIGIYNFDLIKPPVYYKLVSPEKTRFVPLDFDEKMDLKQILKVHPKGIEFGHIINKFDKYPILMDSKDRILSMPPIINSNDVGKITTKTRNVFVEVTGTQLQSVVSVLNYIILAMIDRGGTLYTTKVVYPKKQITTPDLSKKIYTVKLKDASKLIGFDIDYKTASNCLEKARYNVLKADKKNITVSAPCYRTDVISEVDIIEDIAIMYGFSNITPQKLEIPTFGSISKLEEYSNKIRELLIGFGFQEFLNFTLTSKDILFKNMNQKQEDVIEISNPVSENYCVLRHKILPLLINTLSKNTHLSYPQKIFEVGDVSEDVKTKKHACVIYTNCGFTNIKSILDSLMNNLGLKIKLAPSRDDSFIHGRVANIVYKNEIIGVIGEIHPEVLEKNNIIVPVSAFELDISKLFE